MQEPKENEYHGSDSKEEDLDNCPPPWEKGLDPLLLSHYTYEKLEVINLLICRSQPDKTMQIYQKQMKLLVKITPMIPFLC